MLGDLTPIASDYGAAQYAADVASYEVVKSVHVEAVPADPLAETRWLHEIAERSGLPHAIVGRIELHKPGAEKLLAEHCGYKNVRGVRQILNWHRNPRFSFTDFNFLENSAWLAGFGLLQKHDLSFDLQIYPNQMVAAADLAARHPDTLLILNHAGMPVDRDEAGIEAWRAGVKRLAAEPNIVAKVSGLGMVDHGWNESTIRPFVLDAIDRFGIDRVMFGSNFPVDKLYSSFDTLYTAFEGIVVSFSESEKDKLFHDNALRTYRL